MSPLRSLMFHRRSAAGFLCLTLVALPVAASAAGPAETNPGRQQQTMKTVGELGLWLMAWIVDNANDHVPEPPAKGEEISIRDLPLLDTETLRDMLTPDYIQEVPETDGWGHALEVYLDVDNTGAGLIVRAPGADDAFSGDTYTVGTFPPGQFREDIVYMSGDFVRRPVRHGNRPVR